MENSRLEKQINFLMELDKLKTVLRQSYLTNNSRQENSAEHSWHLGLLAMILAEHSDEPIDVFKVIKMVLVHDVIEIDAGDTFIYDVEANKTKEFRENKAADRIFNLLPEDQAKEIRALWDEFELQNTPESRFANTIDKLHPTIQNYYSKGTSWKKHGITKQQTLEKTSLINKNSKTLGEYTRNLFEDALKQGFIKP